MKKFIAISLILTLMSTNLVFAETTATTESNVVPQTRDMICGG